jgi:23S rRNA pseudouridine955/2504/2580 synthase
MRKLTVETNTPIRLSVWLKAQFPMLPGWAVKEALKNKDIKVNGKRIGSDIELRQGDEVLLYIVDEKLDGPALEVPWISENIVVAVKPQGVTSKSDEEADMEALVSAWLIKRVEAPPEVHACHRLDHQTGGLMIFARSEQAKAAVRALMDAGKIVKTYACIVKGIPDPKSAVLTSYMRKDSSKALVTVFGKPVPGARTAITEYKLIGTDGTRSLLEVRLHTGRTHQIRAQMAHIGCPLLGDDKYGDREFNKQYKARKQKLWACALEFNFSAEECSMLADLAGKTLKSPAPFWDELKKELDSTAVSNNPNS